MTTPGVGPVVALTFRATVDVPSRFKNSKAVGAAFGLTPRRQQSGEIDRMGGISKSGDAMTREMLFEAALVLMTHSRKWSWLKAWGMKIARHRGMKRASLEQKRSCGGMTGADKGMSRNGSALRIISASGRLMALPFPN